eukprot:jgi/Botrbrau1/2875/Bobra.0036s0020.1
MAIILSDKPHASMYVLLVCIFLSLASLMAQSVTTPSQTSQDPSAQFDPLKGIMTPLTIPVEAFSPQAHDTLVPGEAQSSAMASAAAEPTPLITTAPGVDRDLPPVPGGKAVVPTTPFQPRVADLPVELEQSNPNPLAQGEPESPSNSSNAKPAVCVSNPALTFFGRGSIQTSVCRAYLYTNSRRDEWSACTAWFVTPTHAVLAAHCVMAEGTGKRPYFPVLVNGRYGTMCCRTQNDTGPDNCEAGYGFKVTRMVTTNGWANRGSWSNDGAVLKLVRPSPTLGGVGAPIKFGQSGGQSGSPFCPATVAYAGYPASSSEFEGCNIKWAERLGFATTTGVINCITAAEDPTMQSMGSVCPGMSGGPMFDPSTNIVNGIVSQGHIGCSTTKRSSIWFAAVTNSARSWGVHVAGLVAAIP